MGEMGEETERLFLTSHIMVTGEAAELSSSCLPGAVLSTTSRGERR